MKAKAACKQPVAAKPLSGRKLKPGNAPLSRWQIPPQLTRTVAYTIIGLSVLGGFLLTPPPVAVGIALLAVLRLWIFLRAERRAQSKGDFA